MSEIEGKRASPSPCNPSAKKTDSAVETGAESELIGHGDSLLMERLLSSEEVS